jgi:hypothetical protein
MASANLTLPREAEVERVVCWRLEELERAGNDRSTARKLAERTEVDLHLAVALARSGCPSATALSILL